jgi:hypothetical protein
VTTNQEKKLSTSDLAAADRDRPAPHADPDDRVPPAAASSATEEAPAPLFAIEDASGYRTRWGAIQTGFVDEPRKAVEEADTLVAEVMKRLAEVFSDERRQLESQWERADQISTEDLRLAMRRYRSFFERLLAI